MASKYYWRKCPKKYLFAKSFRYPLIFYWNDHLGEEEHVTDHKPNPFTCPQCKGTGKVRVKRATPDQRKRSRAK